MASLVSIVGRNRRHITATFILFSLIVYLSYHLVSGNSGIFAMMQLTKKLEEAQGRLAVVHEERVHLQNNVKMMSPESLDLDLLDEQARKVLGHSKPGEIIYFLPEDGPASD